MENKIGEIQSDITLDDLKMLIKCRYKRGDRGLMAIGILYLIAAMAKYIYMHFVGFTSHPYGFLILGFFILFSFLSTGKKHKQLYEKLQEIGEISNHYEFYEDYFIKSNETTTVKVYYDKIEEIYEDKKFIACFTEMERNMLFRKDDCTELILEKMRNAITPKKKSKLKRHKIKGDILFAVIAIPIIIYIILTLAMGILIGIKKADYPYATYDSFAACAKAGYVEDVVVHNKKISFKFTKDGRDEYYNVSVKDNKDEAIEILDENGIDWEYAE